MPSYTAPVKDMMFLFEKLRDNKNYNELEKYNEVSADLVKDILEEAANITGLHNRKHESQLKLNSAANNLDRLSDIELTIQEQINDLSKQARQAARYRLSLIHI